MNLGCCSQFPYHPYKAMRVHWDSKYHNAGHTTSLQLLHLRIYSLILLLHLDSSIIYTSDPKVFRLVLVQTSSVSSAETCLQCCQFTQFSSLKLQIIFVALRCTFPVLHVLFFYMNSIPGYINFNCGLNSYLRT